VVAASKDLKCAKRADTSVLSFLAACLFPSPHDRIGRGEARKKGRRGQNEQVRKMCAYQH
jgi:hypothetical protein